MKKMVSIVALMLVTVVLFTSCRSGDYMDNVVEDITPNRIEVSYSEFNGAKEYTLSVEEQPHIFFEVVTDSGILDLQIYQKGNRDEPVYETTEINTLSISVDVEPNTEYDIVLQAEKHVGSFLFYSKV